MALKKQSIRKGMNILVNGNAISKDELLNWMELNMKLVLKEIVKWDLMGLEILE